MERSEIRGGIDARRQSRITLRSIRATALAWPQILIPRDVHSKDQVCTCLSQAPPISLLPFPAIALLCAPFRFSNIGFHLGLETHRSKGSKLAMTDRPSRFASSIEHRLPRRGSAPANPCDSL